jgi:hypothetical protein
VYQRQFEELEITESSEIFTTSGANNRRTQFSFRKTRKNTKVGGVTIAPDDDDDDEDIREFRRVYLISRPIPKLYSCDSTSSIENSRHELALEAPKTQNDFNCGHIRCTHCETALLRCNAVGGRRQFWYCCKCGNGPHDHNIPVCPCYELLAM